jgi:hypothetical protein
MPGVQARGKINAVSTHAAKDDETQTHQSNITSKGTVFQLSNDFKSKPSTSSNLHPDATLGAFESTNHYAKRWCSRTTSQTIRTYLVHITLAPAHMQRDAAQ